MTNLTIPAPPDDFEMYTDRGDSLVHFATLAIAQRVETGEIRRPSELIEAVSEMIEELRRVKVTEEISDTEPRVHLERWMAKVCRVMEWDAAQVEWSLS